MATSFVNLRPTSSCLIGSAMDAVFVSRGERPIILTQPHSGTYVPEEIYTQLNSLGQQLLDTDWHIPKLYEGLIEGATIIRANFNRYAIDANRDPQGRPLYPGQNSTELVPLTSFDGKEIWANKPSEGDIKNRLLNLHGAYHKAISREIDSLKQKFREVLIYDCHSIRSTIPYLFDGRLPDLNIGSNSGAACASDLALAIERVCKRSSEFSYVMNGRFKGGWTTRHYGRPKQGVHAIQMELSQACYLKKERPPFEYDDKRANILRETLANILQELVICIENKSSKRVES